MMYSVEDEFEAAPRFEEENRKKGSVSWRL